jgi:DinB superfamily
MKNTADDLRKTIELVLPMLKNIGDKDSTNKPLPNKWSKKEILGHLIDSACNNQQKFVRLQAKSELKFVGYEQDFWVESQKYNSADWQNLIILWQSYNFHLAHIIENVSVEASAHKITVENAGTFTLKFIVRDYVEHLKHHLNQIIPTLSLKNEFQNIYNT